MLILTVVAALLLSACLLRPDLPLSRGAVGQALRLVNAIRNRIGLGRALVAIGFALLIYAGVWALQGDAPLFLAMILPELAGWIVTFEIATLVDAIAGIGIAVVGARSAGLANYVKGRMRARRSRPVRRAERLQANDDEPGGWALAA